MRSKEFQAITTLLNFQLVVREGLPRKFFTYVPELGGSRFFPPLILHQPAFYTEVTIVVYFYFKMAFHYRN